MPIELKDKISIVFSVGAMVISIVTFAIVEHRQAVEREDREARLLQSMYTLGLQMEQIRRSAGDLAVASVQAPVYRSYLEKMRDEGMLLVQMTLDQWELKAQINKFATAMEEGVNFVGDEIRGRYGVRAVTAYELGRRVSDIYERQNRLLPGTEDIAKCESLDIQMLHDEQVRKDDLHVAPRGRTECEWGYLHSFPSAVILLNNAIASLGGPIEITRYPKTMNEANQALGSALGALQAKWER
jgi:hypothetical protein